MKKIILISGCLALVFNLLLGLLLSGYEWFNMGVNCGIIILNTILLFCLYQFNLRDAFRISFSFLFSLLAVAEIILGCLMPQQFQDNGYLISLIVLLFIEITLFVVTNIMSNKIKSKTMSEQEYFEQSLKQIFNEIREERKHRLDAAITNAQKYINSINNVEFNINKANIIVEGQRSIIALDGHIYALLSKVNYRIIYKSHQIHDVYQYFIEVELNIE